MKGQRPRAFAAFWDDTSGAVTVDWVVLTAAVVGLAVMVVTPIALETESMTEQTADYIDDVPVGFMSQ